MSPSGPPPTTASPTQQPSTGPEASADSLIPQSATASEATEPLPADDTGTEQTSTGPEATEALLPAATGTDPPHWLDAALHQPLPPEPADGVIDLLAPLLDGPLLVVDRPAPPTVVELVALHRVEVEADYVEPPVIGAGDEPAIPARFAAGLSVLPHIDFPT